MDATGGAEIHCAYVFMSPIGPASVTIGLSAPAAIVYGTYQIVGASFVSSSKVSSTSTTPDPPPVSIANPSDTLWVVVFGSWDVFVVTEFPQNFAVSPQISKGSAMNLAMAGRYLTSNTENPGPATITVSHGWAAGTFAFARSGQVFNGLKADWTFQEGVGLAASDSTTGGNVAILKNGATWGDRSVVLDGTKSQYLLIPNDSGSELSGFPFLTISTWLRPTAQSDAEIIDVGLSSGLATAYQFRLVSNLHLRLFINGASGCSGTQHGESSSGSIPLNQWSFVAATFNGFSYTFYINGAFDSSFRFTNCINDEPGVSTIGSFSMGSGGFFNGTIGRTRIYSTIRSPEEILSQYQVGPPGSLIGAGASSEFKSSILILLFVGFLWLGFFVAGTALKTGFFVILSGVSALLFAITAWTTTNDIPSSILLFAAAAFTLIWSVRVIMEERSVAG